MVKLGERAELADAPAAGGVGQVFGNKASHTIHASHYADSADSSRFPIQREFKDSAAPALGSELNNVRRGFSSRERAASATQPAQVPARNLLMAKLQYRQRLILRRRFNGRPVVHLGKDLSTFQEFEAGSVAIDEA